MKNKFEKIVPIILAGGKGTRLWPISREARPKQFLPFTESRSLFQQALERVSDPQIYELPIVITNQQYRFLVAEQALECDAKLNAIILEPATRNTCPAITVAALWAAQNHKNPVLHVLPSDQTVTVCPKYFCAIQTARKTATKGQLVTFGITPQSPEAGFGYIKVGEKYPCGAHKVSQFVEKPSTSRAKEMIKSGKYYWNSGMLMFTASAFLPECQSLAPEVYSAAKSALSNAKTDLDFIRLDEKSFLRSPNISVDYAIFEKTDRAAVVPGNFQWADLGSWDAVWKSSSRDKNNNLKIGPAQLHKTSNSLVYSTKQHVTLEGLDGLAVISSEDALYVGPLATAQNISAMVKKLRDQPHTRTLTQSHLTTYRPWGGFTKIENGKNYQVKRLFVKPGKRLSLQTHKHRSEHWIIVQGEAEVQVEKSIFRLHKNQSTYIPKGAIHRLFNPGKELLELIEIQTGTYLEDDDILRLEDDYGTEKT